MNPDIQMCILLYDERVETYRRMREIDVFIDDQPELSKEMVLTEQRNHQAHAELQAYNDHKVFVYKHPITRERKQYEEMLSELYRLKKEHPGELMNEIANITQNIRRIQSNINKNKYKSEEELESWKGNLSRAKMRKKVLEEVISK